MYKPSTYSVITYFSTYLPIYIYTYIWTYDLLLTEWVIEVKPDINSVEVHSQLSHNKHVVHGVLMVAGSLLAAGDCVFYQCWAVLQ